jgi:hypothetical protein
MHGVPEFGHALLSELGAPKSTVIETFAEVRFKDSAGKAVIPDGAIVCRRGKKVWACLVEVKTGSSRLQDDQAIEFYRDLVQDLRPWQPPAPKVHSSPEPSEVAGDGQSPVAAQADEQYLSVGPGPSRSPLPLPDAVSETGGDKSQNEPDPTAMP